MIRIVTKSNCIYCQVLKDWLLDSEVKFEEELATTGGAYPKVYYSGKLVFTGLPSITELDRFVSSVR